MTRVDRDLRFIIEEDAGGGRFAGLAAAEADSRYRVVGDDSAGTSSDWKRRSRSRWAA